MSSLWYIGANIEAECNVGDPRSSHQPRHCKWADSMPILDIAVGGGHLIYAVKSERNELLCFGFIRESETDFIPDQVSALCLLYLDRLKQYWSAGYNGNGECGVKEEETRPYLNRVDSEGLDNVMKVKSGIFGGSTLWIKYDGSLYLNGYNKYGQLGMNGTEDVRVPTLSAFTQQHSELRCVDGVSSGGFNVVVADDGSAWFAGEIGDDILKSEGAFTMLKVPNQNGDRIVSVSAGDQHLILLTQNGSVLSLGSEYDQITGDRLGDIQENLTKISYFDENKIKIQSICSGVCYNLAFSADGKVYGWGLNHYGQCGVSDGENRKKVKTPELIDIGLNVAVQSIECGFHHSGLMTVDHEVYLWGYNDYNECCGNSDNEEIRNVFTPQNVTDYVLSESKKNKITHLYMGKLTTYFLLD